jgi:uncharacterized protein
MLSFDLGSLARHAAHVDAELSPDDPVWQEGDPHPAEPIRVTGRLSSAGHGRFYLHARMEGAVALECRRCLTDVLAPVSEEMHVVFAEDGDDEATDDPDVYRFDPRAPDLDIRPAVREQWLLSAPSYAQCSDDCKGLCPTCGADLNATTCDCAPSAPDVLWDALRQLKSRSE